MLMICDYCGEESDRYAGHINRAKKIGAGLYCDRKCAGLGRRSNKTPEQKKEEKRLYDIAYREKMDDYRKDQKAAYYKTPAGRAVQKRNREKMKDRHAAYCRTDEYRAWKREYDQQYCAKKDYGEYWEAALVLREIEKEIEPEVKETRIQRGVYNKSQKRKRAWNSMRKTLNKHYGTP